MSQQTLQQYLLSTHDLFHGRGYYNKPFTVKIMRQSKTKLLEAVPLTVINVCSLYLLLLLDCERPWCLSLPARYSGWLWLLLFTHARGAAGSEQGFTISSFLITDNPS